MERPHNRKLPVFDPASHLIQNEPRAHASSEGSRDVSRREFGRLLSQAMAAAGVLGCNRAPDEEIVPYVRRPAEVTPGLAQYYATTVLRSGYGVGLLAESHTGRPTKIEGHPGHPASQGGTFLQEQAEVLGLYDPDRARSVLRAGQIASERAFFEARPRLIPKDGRGVHILIEPTASPLAIERLNEITARLFRAHIHVSPMGAPLSRWEGLRLLFGEAYDPQIDFSSAEVVVDLDSNFLGAGPMSIRWSRDFAERRVVDGPADSMSRLYSVESALSITGTMADHRLAIAASRVVTIAAALFSSIASQRGGEVELLRSSAEPPLSEPERQWVKFVSDDLLKHAGRAVVLAGDRQAAPVHALAAAINELLGNAGRTVHYCLPALHRAEQPQAYAIQPLLEALKGGEVHTLFICGGNPSYALPHDLRWRHLVQQARHVVQLSPYENESSQGVDWFIPEKHFLEAWGDARAYDGTVSFRQPLIRPLYGGSTLEEMLAWIAGDTDAEGKSLLERLWVPRLGGKEQFRAALSRGFLPDSNSPFVDAVPDWQRLVPLVEVSLSRQPGEELELDLVADPRVEEGRLANNAWLQETPEPVTKLVWDNALMMHPRTAQERGLSMGDIVEVRSENRTIFVPVLPVPDQARAAVSLWLGFGRSGSEQVAKGVGVDAGPLRSIDSPWIVFPVSVRSTGRHHELVRTQVHFDMHDRPVALHQTLDEFKKRPDQFGRYREEQPTTFPLRTSGETQWAMAIDLNKCTGCSTCVVACIAENNIPTVGKQLVAKGREMHWMRIDTYREGTTTVMQPMLCQHCEKAPCEYVCPVNATVHSEDGLNEMIYNRCVGTRFCSNNCPYKVRRFNWFDFNRRVKNPRLLAFNPDVTVRARGVMEKCTFCVQRIRRAEIDAKLAHRELKEGDVTSACAQACPTRAIEFGPLSDPASRVSKLHQSQRAYACLNELGTRPRVRYLARLLNVRKGTPR